MAEDVKTAETNEEVTTVAADEESTKQATEDTQPSESASQSAPEAKKEPTKQKTPQTDKENAEYARARREREKQAEIEKATAEAVKAERVKNIIDLVKTNPFTNKPIKTAEDAEQYLLMKQIDADGGEPLQDYASYVDKKARDAEEAKKQAEQSQAQIHSDIAEFKTAHPDVKLEELLKDETFTKIYGEKVGVIPLTKLYSDYQSFIGKIREQERTKLAAEVAKANSGVGSVSTPGTIPEITAAQFKRMGLEAKEKLFAENPALYRELANK